MALALRQGGTSGPSNPVIVFVYIEPRVSEQPFDDPGFITDVESLTYRVVRSNGTELLATTAVDLDAHRIRAGTYAPPITIGGADPIGVYKVEWTAIRAVATDSPITWVTSFQVVVANEVIPEGSYVLVSEMRYQGVPPGFIDENIALAVQRASQFVEHVTRRFFEPRYMTFERDGRGEGILIQLDDPVIGLEDITVTFSDFRAAGRLIDRTQVRVYNRHIRPTPLRSPDDRDNPKISILRIDDPVLNSPRLPALSRRFQPAQQNVQLTGWFGYTDPDGSPLGCTPVLLKRAVAMIAMRDMRPLWGDFGGTRRGLPAGSVVSERTRDQQVSYASGRGVAGVLSAGWITGDPEIDNILSMFIGPMNLAAV